MRNSRAQWLSISLGMLLGVSGVAHAASSAKLNWTIPTTRENGQALALSELTGYEVYYTTDDPNVTATIKVTGGSTSTYTVQNLAPGNYHFAMSAVDVGGLKSKLSTVADVVLVATTTTSSTGTATGTTTSGTSGGTTDTSSGSGSSSSTTSTSTSTTTSTTTASSASGTSGTSKSIRVSWSIPTARADGTPLSVSELAGYQILLYQGYTKKAGAMVKDGGASSYVIANVTKGTYSVWLTAVDTTGKKSSLVSKLITVQ